MAGNKGDKEGDAGLVTLILRDPSYTETIRALIRREGGRAFSNKPYNFETIHDCKEALDLLENSRQYHMAVFASPHGVQSLMQLAMRHNKRLPKNLMCAAPGTATRKALMSAGFQNVVAPPGVGDLRTLLRHRDMSDIAGKVVALVQRENSTSHAVQDLRARKAEPVTIWCYRVVSVGEQVWLGIDEGFRRDMNSIIAFEGQSLELLTKHAGDEVERVKKLPLGVIHPAIHDKAKEIGFENIIVNGDSKALILELAKKVGENVG